MKRTAIIIVVLAVALTSSAQVAPQPVPGILEESLDSAWYADQEAAWAKVTQQNPHDEAAWRNRFQAAWYGQWDNEGFEHARQLVAQMKENIPETYTYYYCAYYIDHDPSIAESALQRLPEQMSYKDYDQWAVYLLLQNDTLRLTDWMRRYYESHTYSPAVLQYNYNELQGMEPNAIYIGHGDSVLLPKWILQYGMGVHRDKLIIADSWLLKDDYCQRIFSELGLGPVPRPDHELASQQDYDDYSRQLLGIIISKSHRPVYLFPSLPDELLSPWKNKLYNEGLVLRYAAQPYDNMAVKRRNVEQRYLMDYLLQSFYHETWNSAHILQWNYIFTLTDLLPHYKKSNPRQYERLKTILTSIATNLRCTSEEHRQMALKMISQ